MTTTNRSAQAQRLLGNMGGATGGPKSETQSENEAKRPRTFDQWMIEAAPAIKEALPSTMTVERFTRMILTLYRGSRDLQDCTPASVLGAALQAAQLGLMVGNLDQAYLIPFNNRKRINNDWVTIKEAQLQIGYKGYIQLGANTGKISHIDVEKVYKKDHFDYRLGTNEFLDHVPSGEEEDGEDPTHYYCVVTFTSGKKKFIVRTRKQIIRHAKKHTDMYKDGQLNAKSNWVKNFDPMALKTVIKEIFKTLPLSTEVMQAVQADGTIKHAEPGKVSRNMAEDVIDITDYAAEDVPFPEPPPETVPA